MTAGAFDLYLLSGAVAPARPLRRRRRAALTWRIVLDVAATAIGVTTAGVVIALGIVW